MTRAVTGVGAGFAPGELRATSEIFRHEPTKSIGSMTLLMFKERKLPSGGSQRAPPGDRLQVACNGTAFRGRPGRVVRNHP